MIENNLSKYRKSVDLTQSKFADLIGITPRSYQRYEKGERYLNTLPMACICRMFDISIEKIYPKIFIELGEKINKINDIRRNRLFGKK